MDDLGCPYDEKVHAMQYVNRFLDLSTFILEQIEIKVVLLEKKLVSIATIFHLI